MKDTITWLVKEMRSITSEVFHLVNRSTKVNYPYITFSDTTTPRDEIRDEHRIELNLFDYGTSRVRLMELDEAIREKFDRHIFLEPTRILHVRKGLSNDIPTGDDTIQRRDIELIIKSDRRG